MSPDLFGTIAAIVTAIVSGVIAGRRGGVVAAERIQGSNGGSKPPTLSDIGATLDLVKRGLDVNTRETIANRERIEALDARIGYLERAKGGRLDG